MYPSKCYAVPSVPSIEDKPIVITYDPEEKKFTIEKHNTKVIRFDGVDAVSYDQNDPTTELHPLSREVDYLCF